MTNEAFSIHDTSLLYPGSPTRRHVSPYLSSRLKRSLDVSASLLLIILLAALMIVTALLIRLESRGPVLFIQRRNGLREKKISVFKFRSMQHAPGDIFVQAVRGDLRVTRVGRFIRRTSIDELPQLFNVLRGEMSLVGPRPHPEPLDDRYRSQIDQYGGRFSAVPGMTGLAQVNGARGETSSLESMQRRIDYDNRYVREASLSLDVQILFKTAYEVFLGPSRADVF